MKTLPTNQWTQELPWIDRPGANVRAYLSNKKTAAPFDVEQKLLFWQENGFVVFENAVEKSLLDQFEEEIEYIRTHSHDRNISIELQGKQTYTRAVAPDKLNDPGVKFNHLHTVSKYAAQLSLVPAVSQFLQIVFEAPAAVTQSLTFWRGSQQPIHIDYPFVCRQKRLAYIAASWIPLEDISPEAGPLEYYPGAHKIAISGFFNWGNGDIIKGADSMQNSMEFAKYLEERVKAAGIVPVVFCPRKGDVLIWHGNMPHAGTAIKNPELTRKSYVTHYTSLADYPDSWKIPSEQWDHRSIHCNGGYAFQYPWTDEKDALPSWTT
ncbi:phytanoyl-CoA dioxygenase family protein [Bradyrhizobium sp. CB82]|uniref:phytanoyl-CoA dioxygenase family protein n=1 Tax=Bradyrhizobium sp. CB82 TaxID=3039159 RepID=UPI0024B05A61|nr:phytanoyl-CoA dioxygenase family protein [Bradyrhizobium sp. CB82]WFU39440.1 phytanoyl-CoA dioxygenase family protein [Bradyrhizobium sp. CB82]